MKAIAIFKNEVWCMDVAYVDKVAKGNNGEEYLLVRQDLFDRTVNSEGKKTKDSKKTVRAFLTTVTKKIIPEKKFAKGTKFAGEFKKLCEAEEIQTYSTMIETKAAFAERTKRSLKKNTIPLLGRQGIQVPLQTDSIRYSTNF